MNVFMYVCMYVCVRASRLRDSGCDVSAVCCSAGQRKQKHVRDNHHLAGM